MINKWICFPEWLWRQSTCVLFPRDIFGRSRHSWGALDHHNLYCTPYLPEKNKKRIYLARLRTPRPPQGGAGYHYGADWWPMDISRPNVIVTLSRSWVYLYLSWWISPRLMWVSIYTPKEHKADIPGQDRSLYDLITLGTVRTPSMVYHFSSYARILTHVEPEVKYVNAVTCKISIVTKLPT